VSEDVHQKPRHLRVNIEGNFFPVLQNIFKFRKIGTILNSSLAFAKIEESLLTIRITTRSDALEILPAFWPTVRNSISELEKSLEGKTEGHLVCGHSDVSKFLGANELTQFPISKSNTTNLSMALKMGIRATLTALSALVLLL
jgi:hypothetical protein